MRARSQRGWTLIVILAALAIVAFLARDALVQYFQSATRTGSSEASRLSPTDASAASDATPLSPQAIERARAIEDVVRRQHDDLSKRIESGSRP